MRDWSDVAFAGVRRSRSCAFTIFACNWIAGSGTLGAVNVEDPAAAQLAAIRAELQRNGGATIDRKKLGIFCPETMSAGEQFNCIAAMARAENWSFAFLPDGSVRFGSYMTASSRA
jgi:hypothetical protein